MVTFAYLACVGLGLLPDGTKTLTHLRADSAVHLPDCGRLEMALDLHFPRQADAPPIVLVCLPGGGMNRKFFDLMPPAEPGAVPDSGFSFARQMTARGFVVAIVDHLGVGESDRPQEPYALTVESLAQAAANVVHRIREQTEVHYGRPLPELCTIGVGHSMGAMVTIVQQARHRSHRAIAALGFSTRGLPEYVPEPLHSLAADPDLLSTRLAGIARGMFPGGYQPRARTPESRGIFAGNRADPRGIGAIEAANDAMLPLPAMLSMIPGNVARDAAAVDVPVYAAVGDRDMVGPTAEVPAAFSASPRVELQVLPETGHSHFLFAARFDLFDGLARWARSVAQNQVGTFGTT